MPQNIQVRIEWCWGSSPSGPDALRPLTTGPLCPNIQVTDIINTEFRQYVMCDAHVPYKVPIRTQKPAEITNK
jgi:hypothetical protein